MESLSQAGFESLIAGAVIVEATRRGPKVYETPTGQMVKLFRAKCLFSSNLRCPYALRFARNAARLEALGIASVRVTRVAKVPHLARQVVVYDKLPGRSLRQCLRDGCSMEVMQRAGRFVAAVQNRGVYFRSFHFGNILVAPDGQFALIDILDVRFRWRPLGRRRRLRNFSALLSYAEDRQALAAGWTAFSEGYAAAQREANPILPAQAVEGLLAAFRQELERAGVA